MNRLILLFALAATLHAVDPLPPNPLDDLPKLDRLWATLWLEGVPAGGQVRLSFISRTGEPPPPVTVVTQAGQSIEEVRKLLCDAVLDALGELALGGVQNGYVVFSEYLTPGVSVVSTDPGIPSLPAPSDLTARITEVGDIALTWRAPAGVSYQSFALHIEGVGDSRYNVGGAPAADGTYTTTLPVTADPALPPRLAGVSTLTFHLVGVTRQLPSAVATVTVANPLAP